MPTPEYNSTYNSLLDHAKLMAFPSTAPDETDAIWSNLELPLPSNVSVDWYLGSSPVSTYTVWDTLTPKHLPCSLIMVTTSARDPTVQSSSFTSHPRFNHIQNAHRDGACLLHMSCEVHTRPDKRGSQYRTNMTERFNEAWNELNVNPIAPKHVPLDPGCSSKIEPYFYKFIAILKLAYLSINGVISDDTEYMFLDEDIMIMNPNKRLELDHRFLRSSHTTAFLALSTDFACFMDRPVDFLNVRIPLNTGLLWGSLTEVRALMELVTNVLLLPTERQEWLQSLVEFWDTDQGAFTYVLSRETKMTSDEIYYKCSDMDLMTHAVELRRPIAQWEFGSRGLVISAWPQRLMASVPREPSLSSRGRPDLAWQSTDWMVHLYPGFPEFKKKAWIDICSKHPELAQACCWSMGTEEEEAVNVGR
eukprot:Blabericola_migrator_1__10968@NODE_634_length_7135_cov_65_670770_g465_i0_p2_GENE_NODE_634_length_7135_cov_65_670770_g465_i0NODE_634_length_7135_cov_65_670770_g465_i0_p2_ORF_typecomplete_len489_score73_33Glyco_transf_34/PF05637_12/0_001DUF273/PF03314_14/0_23DUF273/PF03314_14/4_1e03_NODE_634_length_7135_cov_65_670770_g465_i02111467